MTNLTMQIQFKELNYRGQSGSGGKFPEETRKGMLVEGKERVARRSERIFEREYV